MRICERLHHLGPANMALAPELGVFLCGAQKLRLRLRPFGHGLTEQILDDRLDRGEHVLRTIGMTRESRLHLLPEALPAVCGFGIIGRPKKSSSGLRGLKRQIFTVSISPLSELSNVRVLPMLRPDVPGELIGT